MGHVWMKREWILHQLGAETAAGDVYLRRNRESEKAFYRFVPNCPKIGCYLHHIGLLTGPFSQFLLELSAPLIAFVVQEGTGPFQR
jgi:hypothetical protein